MSHEELRESTRPLPGPFDSEYTTTADDMSERCRQVRAVLADLDAAHRKIAALRADNDRLIRVSNGEYARGWDDGFKTGQTTPHPRVKPPFIPGVYPRVAPSPTVAPKWPGHTITVTNPQPITLC